MKITKQINLVPEGANLLSIGGLDEKIIRNIKMTTSLYKYIETQFHSYDGDDPEFNNWIDIEGFGYGWLWLLNHEESQWRQMMLTKLVSYLDYISETRFKDAIYAVYQYDDIKVYHFSTFLDYREDYVFRFSNSELR